MKKILRPKGFTLIEVLLVVVIISILAAIVIVAINPAAQIEAANDAKRRNDVRVIMDAVSQYAIDNDGDYPTGITGSAVKMTNTTADICSDLVEDYISEMPVDPVEGSYTDCDTYDTGYTILKTAGGRITIAAPEATETISITR